MISHRPHKKVVKRNKENQGGNEHSIPHTPGSSCSNIYTIPEESRKGNKRDDPNIIDEIMASGNYFGIIRQQH